MNSPHDSVRNRRFVACLSPLFIGLALGGCSALPMTEKFENLEIPENDPSFRTRVYAGATMGNSHLTPNTSGTEFSVDNSDDLGTQMRLGVDVHNMLAVELETSVLGTAKLREHGTDVSYSAASVNALVYGLNGVQKRSRREGWSAYGKLGMGIVKRASAVTSLDESGTSPIIGAGAEYGFANGLGIRGEIVRYDSDAVYAGLGAVYRFGLSPKEFGGVIAQAVEPALRTSDRPIAAGGRMLKPPRAFDRDATLARNEENDSEQNEPSLGAAAGFHAAEVHGVSRWRPVMYKDDHDRDGVRDLEDYCADTGPHVIVDPKGCGLFDEVLADVTFKSGSHYLTARARGALDTLAERLLEFPEARVRIVAHTDATGPADENLDLSARRAESVVQYLQTQYVRELQLEAMGLGETRPIASNRSAEGRKRNRRVEVVTVASLNEQQLADSLEKSELTGVPQWLPPAPGSSHRKSRAAGPDGIADWTPKQTPIAIGPDEARAEVADDAIAAATAAATAASAAAAAASAAAAAASAAAAKATVESVALNAEPRNGVESTDVAMSQAMNEERDSGDDRVVTTDAGQAVEEAASNASLAPTTLPALGAAATTVTVTGPLGPLTDGDAALPAPALIDGLDITGVVDGVTFNPGSALLPPSAKPPLANVAARLQAYPSARVAIMAHTDNVGTDEENLALSRRRADNVLEHLVDLGVDRPRLEAEGYGETLPLAQNVTEADRARNRRIELRLLGEDGRGQ